MGIGRDQYEKEKVNENAQAQSSLGMIGRIFGKCNSIPSILIH
jgi:hypothetical protein